MGLGSFWAKITGQKSNRNYHRALDTSKQRAAYIGERETSANLLGGDIRRAYRPSGQLKFTAQERKRLLALQERYKTRVETIQGKKRMPGRAQTVLTGQNLSESNTPKFRIGLPREGNRTLLG